MAKLKSQSQKYVELKEEDYLYKAMEHILEHEHIDLLVKPVSRRYS